MGKVHVWLVEDGGPASPAELRPWLERRHADPARLQLPWWLGFLRGLVLWWRCRRDHKRLLPACEAVGRAPELDAVVELATELQHALGPRYAVRAVLRHGARGPEAAAAELPRGARVVVVDLAPDGSTALRPDLAAVLARREAEAVVAGHWLGSAAWQRLRLRSIRAALARLTDEQGVLPPHELVFAVRSAPSERAEAAAVALRDALNRAQPARLAHVPDLDGRCAGRSPRETLEQVAADGPKPVIVVPVGFGVAHLEAALALGAELRAQAQQLGLQPYLEVPPPAGAGEAGRMLAEGVQAAERAEGWTVPEDVVRGDIEAALRLQGIEPIPRGIRG
jgi:protoheme ferro-lyase